MTKLCLKCGYERQPTDSAPDYECPQCGAIYAKVEAALKAVRENANHPKSDAAREDANHPKSDAASSETAPGKPETASAEEKTKRCPECGEIVLAIAKKCKHCQSIIPGIAAVIFEEFSFEEFADANPKSEKNSKSEKKIMSALLLWFFFGALAFHKFYAGRYISGLFQLIINVVTFGYWFIVLQLVASGFTLAAVGELTTSAEAARVIALFGSLFALLWLLIDFISIIAGQYKDGNGKRIAEWT
jgi:predicted RNA-binding Zn-ribbon protein involved in translation (DUF1610 family)/TM2 domain-containing membrane protein YozV